MKRLLLQVLFLLAGVSVYAEYEPTTVWPYIYEDFADGIVVYSNGQAHKAKFNIHLEAAELQYLDGDRIMTSNLDVIDYAVMADEKYVVADGKMMKVYSENDSRDAFLLILKVGDLASLQSGTGAYGSNANTQAVSNRSSLDLGGKLIVDHSKLLADRKEDSGKELPIKETKYIKVRDKCCKAFQKDVEREFGLAGNDQWKSFLKTNKIKWRKEDDLFKVVEYLYSL